VEVLGVAPEKGPARQCAGFRSGAESIDLLDLSFRIEEKFEVRIEANEIEREAKKRLPGGAYEKDGYLTEAALDEIRKSTAGIGHRQTCEGSAEDGYAALLTVSFFVHLIARKLAARRKEWFMFDNRRAFVTGGTGRVGTAIVRCLAEGARRWLFSSTHMRTRRAARKGAGAKNRTVTRIRPRSARRRRSGTIGGTD